MRSAIDAAPVLEPTPALLRLAGRLAGDDDADDLVQSTMVRALEHDGEAHEPGPWLRRVLINQRWMQLRATRRRQAREQAAAEPAPEAVDLEHVVQCMEVARIVGSLVDELDVDLRTVIRARYFDDENSTEIARRHGIPAGTVRWRLKLGLEQLRERLDARYGGRRALWAGVVAPIGVEPTLASTAASPSMTGGSVTLAPAKGMAAMGIKIVIGLVLLGGGAAAGVAAVRSPAQVADANAIDGAPLAAAPAVERGAVAHTGGRIDRPQWDHRRARIRSALADTETVAAPGSSTVGSSPRRQEDRAALAPLPVCGSASCMTRLTSEINELFDGCDEFIGASPPELTLSANVIGAPGVGTIVESVELTSDDPVSAELRECLIENMYTLDLGPAEVEFETPIQTQLGGRDLALEGIDEADLDEMQRLELEAAIAAGEEKGLPQVRMIRIDEPAARE